MRKLLVTKQNLFDSEIKSWRRDERKIPVHREPAFIFGKFCTILAITAATHDEKDVSRFITSMEKFLK